MADRAFIGFNVADGLVFYLVDRQDLSCGDSDVWKKSNDTGDDQMAQVLRIKLKKPLPLERLFLLFVLNDWSVDKKSMIYVA